MILIGLYKYYPYGGLQKDALRLVEELLRRGEKVTCLATSWEGDLPPSHLFHLELVKRKGFSNTARMEHFGQTFREKAETLRKSGGVSLAMNRLPGADFYFAADASRKLVLQNKPFHKLLSLTPRNRAILRQEKDVICNSSTHILLLCKKQGQELIKEYPELTEDRLTVLPPGINPTCANHRLTPEKRLELRHSLGIDDSRTLVITTGTNWNVKGMDRAMSLLKNTDCNYLIAGNDSPATIEALRKKQRFPSERFIFTGPRDDIADIMAAADLMLHPARNEGGGSVLLEALACALPVICTDVCGFSSFVDDALPGLTIPEPFTQEKAQKILADTLPKLKDLKRHLEITVDGTEYTKRTAFFADLLINKLHCTL